MKLTAEEKELILKKREKEAAEKENDKEVSKNKFKQVKAEPIRLYLEYNQSSTGGEPLSDEKWCDHSDEYITVDFIRFHREQPKHRFFYHSLEINHPDMLKLDALYLAVVRYESGDTFSHSFGNWCVVGVAPTYQIAEKMLEEALDPKSKEYKPWEGYFERFERTEVVKLDVV